MAQDGEQTETPKPATPKKGVSIQIMFPCNSDVEALAVKNGIDAIVSDIKDKRYTFTITEM